ncbi:MAG: ATP-binding cassette domain-containing protein [Pseudanabaenales cyanobacterium]|nr:ATP-binding cassette domain-containing protein [Pseudanabaenales cyanobacterium]
MDGQCGQRLFWGKGLAAQIQLHHVSLAAPVGVMDILTEISFEISAGEFIALVGPSGAGKTSLMRLLNRLIDPTQGAIHFEGLDLCQISVIQHRQQVTLVNQEPRLLGMTVQETMSYPLLLRGLNPTQAQQRIAAWLERLEIPTDWLDRTELQLSVGQRQRVAIARALAIQPKVLLLDEPTSALDPGQASRLMAQLATLAQQQQTTILMSNHQLELIQGSCSRVIYLDQGRIVEDLPAVKVDWTSLRQSIVQTEKQAAEEWE